MTIRTLRTPLMGLPLLLFTLLPCLATERIFILKNEGEIAQYKIRDKQDEVKQVASYSDQDFPGIFPAASIAMKRGNILSVYDRQRHLIGRLVYDPAADRLKLYDGNPGDRAGLSGRLLEDPNLEEPVPPTEPHVLQGLEQRTPSRSSEGQVREDDGEHLPGCVRVAGPGLRDFRRSRLPAHRQVGRVPGGRSPNRPGAVGR